MNLFLGHSWKGGKVLGYVRNTHYTDVVARYSYDMVRYPNWTLRWSPEVMLFAELDEPAPSPTNIHHNVPTTSYGAGISPGSLQGVFFPKSRIQPFLNVDSGIVVYNQQVLADGGTDFLFTVDGGLGVNVFVSRRDAINVGYRYQHQSNADIGLHNPGADSNVFTFGFSHFFDLKSRK